MTFNAETAIKIANLETAEAIESALDSALAEIGCNRETADIMTLEENLEVALEWFTGEHFEPRAALLILGALEGLRRIA